MGSDWVLGCMERCAISEREQIIAALQKSEDIFVDNRKVAEEDTVTRGSGTVTAEITKNDVMIEIPNVPEHSPDNTASVKPEFGPVYEEPEVGPVYKESKVGPVYEEPEVGLCTRNLRLALCTRNLRLALFTRSLRLVLTTQSVWGWTMAMCTSVVEQPNICPVGVRIWLQRRLHREQLMLWLPQIWQISPL